MELVRLSPFEVRVAEYIGEQRQLSAERAGKPNERRDETLTEIGLHIKGMLAELAFAKLANLYPQLDTVIRDTDFTLPSGRTLDVKWTDAPHKRLILPIYVRGGREVPQKSDYYVSMTGESPLFRYKGFVTREIATQKKYRGDLGKGECYVIPNEILDPALPN